MSPLNVARRASAAAVGPTFASLGVRNYRIWAAGALVSNVGTWMQRVAQDWLVLTVLTVNSPLAVGIVTALQFGPILVFGQLAGLLADRVDQRRLLVVTQALQGLWALILGVLVMTGHAELWSVYLLAGLLGVTTAFDNPSRQVFVAAMVPTSLLSNAVGLNSASFNAARLIGPGLAGLLIAAIGTGPVFLLNAATFVATLLSLLALRTSELHPAPRRPRGRGATREGLAYVRSRPDIVLILFVIGLIGAFGLNFQLTTAAMARVEFGKGAAEFGLLGSVLAIGSLSGALVAARRQSPTLRLVVGAALAFGLFATLSAVMPSYGWFALSLVPVGLSSLTLLTAANATVQTTTEPALRGRVMALYSMITMGTTPIGAPLIGWVGEVWGPRWSIGIGGIVSLAAALAALAVMRHRASVLALQEAQAAAHAGSAEGTVTPEPASLVPSGSPGPVATTPRGGIEPVIIPAPGAPPRRVSQPHGPQHRVTQHPVPQHRAAPEREREQPVHAGR